MSTTENNTENDLLSAMNIFGNTVEDVIAQVEEDAYEGGDYTPHLELNPQKFGGEDFAIVKLIPSLVQGNKNVLRKVSYKVNSADGKKFMFDSKKSLGWRDNECIVADEYDTYKDDALALQKYRDVFNYKKPCTVLVQVLKYDNNKELEGRILPLRIYEDVEKLIEKTINPSKEDVELNDVVANQVFDTFTGNALMLKAKLKTQGTNKDGTPKVGRTFEDSSFVKAKAYKHILVPTKDEDGNLITKSLGGESDTIVNVYEKVSLNDEEVVAYESKNYDATSEVYKKQLSIVKFLLDENTPKIEDYGYIEPSEEKVKNVKILLDALANGKTPTLGGTIVTETTDETPTTETTDEVETENDATNDADLENILEQAKAQD